MPVVDTQTVVNVVLGILILAETITWNQPVGGVITILGILISQQVITPDLLRRRDSASRTASAPPLNPEPAQPLRKDR